MKIHHISKYSNLDYLSETLHQLFLSGNASKLMKIIINMFLIYY